MQRTLNVIQIGNSLGVILPKDVLAKLRVEKGEELHLSETPHGVELSALDQNFQDDIAAGDDIAKRYRNTLHNLAK